MLPLTVLSWNCFFHFIPAVRCWNCGRARAARRVGGREGARHGGQKGNERERRRVELKLTVELAVTLSAGSKLISIRWRHEEIQGRDKRGRAIESRGTARYGTI